ncbi:hypothetical protein ACP70R_009360 [Stipagrostis hirtigluma subsp. patula]
MRISLLLAVICVIATPTIAVLEAWYPIANIDNPHMQELGRWAVKEHDKNANDGLKFNRVVRGEEMSVVSGVKYHFIIDASASNGRKGKYEAVLSEHANTRILYSFNAAR